MYGILVWLDPRLCGGEVELDSEARGGSFDFSR